VTALAVRGIRGATTAEVDSAVEIVEATRELLSALIDANDIVADDVAGAWFTTTTDLRTEFPAVAARQLGWVDVPLICGHEMDVPAENPRSIPRCIRAMILMNTEKPQSAIRHVYLRGALAIKQELDRARAGDLPQPANLGPQAIPEKLPEKFPVPVAAAETAQIRSSAAPLRDGVSSETAQ
jgi:chorismate mutase